MLGVTAANTVELGFMDRDEISKKEFTQLISGWGWIVRNGVSNVNYSQDLSYQPGLTILELLKYPTCKVIACCYCFCSPKYRRVHLGESSAYRSGGVLKWDDAAAGGGWN